MNRQLLGPQWYDLLKDELSKEYFKELVEKLKSEYTSTKCYPEPLDIFKVFQLCSFDKVRVVILSQDPYPNAHACGLAFSSMRSETPYSLFMILREMDRDIAKTKNYTEFKKCFPNNDLTPWVNQGVFLLNVCLTVRANEPGSHNNLGWQQFTNKVLSMLWQDSTPKVFVILGKDAKDALYTSVVNLGPSYPHYVIEAGHPASGAHGKDKFSGVQFGSKANRFFELKGLPGIDWKLNAD